MKSMKKILVGLFALVLLAGCGEKAPATVDLQAFYDATAEKYALDGMTALEGDMLQAFYPGLAELDTLQCVAYAPMISAVVSEYVFLQCADKANADKAAEILQQRVDAQAAGGAWYPDSMAAWAKAKVVAQDNYVLLIAGGDKTESVAADFTALLK